VKKLDNPLLGLGGSIAAERFITLGGDRLKLQQGLTGAFLVARERMFSNYSVAPRLDRKFEFNLNLRLTGVDQLIVAGSAALTPERPGYGIDQGGLAVAVISTDAGSVDTFKVDLRDIPIAHKIA